MEVMFVITSIDLVDYLYVHKEVETESKEGQCSKLAHIYIQAPERLHLLDFSQPL